MNPSIILVQVYSATVGLLTVSRLRRDKMMTLRLTNIIIDMSDISFGLNSAFFLDFLDQVVVR